MGSLIPLFWTSGDFPSSRSKDGCEGSPGTKFCQFDVVFGKIWQNHMLVPPGGLASHVAEILDPPLVLWVSKSEWIPSLSCFVA